MAEEDTQPGDDTFEVARNWGLDAAARARQPITLDGLGGLDDALAAARSIRPQGQSTDDDDTAGKPYDLSTPEIEAPAKAPEPAAPAAVADTRDAQIAKLREEQAATNNLYLRAVADLQNFRRRGEEERTRLVREGNERLIKNLLPILDDFDLAVNAAKKTESYEQLVTGVEAIQRKVQEILKKEGVEVIVALGETFDPDYHEAVAIDAESDAEDETVIDDLRRGYTFHGRVLRPSSVRVAKK